MCCWTTRARRGRWSNARATSGISGCCRSRTTSAPAKPCASRRGWCPYDPAWADDARRIINRLKTACGAKALRVDHIGSTAVPGMDAKDVIDVQVTVESLDVADELADVLLDVGYPRHGSTSPATFRTTAIRHCGASEFTEPPIRGGRRMFTSGWTAGPTSSSRCLFVDWLSANPAVRDDYLAAKRERARAPAITPRRRNRGSSTPTGGPWHGPTPPGGAPGRRARPPAQRRLRRVGAPAAGAPGDRDCQAPRRIAACRTAGRP